MIIIKNAVFNAVVDVPRTKVYTRAREGFTGF